MENTRVYNRLYKDYEVSLCGLRSEAQNFEYNVKKADVEEIRFSLNRIAALLVDLRYIADILEISNPDHEVIEKDVKEFIDRHF